ncbi:MAG: alpha/beta hydrolase [Nannocystaceae bacterium]|nr:alpha/beta hydrolase [bacterium]
MQARLFALGLAVGITACDGGSLDAPRVAFEDCHLSGGEPARCASFEVAENPDEPQGRTLSLSVAVVPAREPEARPPVVLIAGGPGQASQSAYGAALSAFEALRQHHDIVLLDQRGTGKSGALRCEDTAVLDLADAVSMKVDAQRLLACRDGQDADLTQYTTARAVEDLDHVLGQLGYAKAHLVGASYGTRVALAFARAHPQRTASIVIDGVAPVDFAMPLSFAKDAQAALEAMVDDCEADAACAAAFPTLGVDVREIASKPAADVTVRHPRTGADESLELSGRALVAGMRSMLYAPELASLLPLSVTSASAGDFGPLVAQAALLGDGIGGSLSEGMFLSVVCAEDVPFITDERAADETADTVLGMMFVEHLRASCEHWVRAPIPDGFREPVVSDVPALVLSGAIDPVTPPRWGEHALAGLSNGRHIVVPGAGHGITTLPCADEVLAEFFATGDARGVDASCLESRTRPPFFIDFAGPKVNQ